MGARPSWVRRWADLAVANGYSDQSHLVREFRTFGALPPAHLFTAEWYGATTATQVGAGPHDVRSVQDRSGETKQDDRRRQKP